MIFHLMSTEQPECQVFFFNGTGRYHNEQTLLKATPDPSDMKKKSEFWKEIPLGEFPSKCSESKNTSDISISYSHILNVLVELSWEQKLKKAKS